MRNSIYAILFAPLCLYCANWLHAAELNVANVERAAIGLEPNFDADLYSIDFLQMRDPQRYSSVSHDPAQLEVEVKKRRDEVTKQRAQFVRGELLTARGIGTIESVDDQGLVRIGVSSDMGLHVMELENSEPRTYLPPSYNFFLANTDLFGKLALAPEQRERINHLMSVRGRLQARVEVDLEMVKIQQHRNFQAVIRAIRLYDPSDENAILTKVTDSRNAEKLIKARPLAEGLTLNGVPDHSFRVANVRFGEHMDVAGPALGQCSEQKRLRGHRVFDCKNQQFMWGMQIRYTLKYVGGLLVKGEFFAPKEGLSEKQVEMFATTAQKDLNRANFNVDPQWTTGCCTFRYLPNGVGKKAGGKPMMIIVSKLYDAVLAGKPGTEFQP
jgi:hypothetical protein